MKLNTNFATLVAILAATSLSLTNAILVQPYNYMLDDSALVNQPDGGSFSPFYNDQSSGGEQHADKDIISIIGDGLARLKYARMLDNQEESAQQHAHFSQEMAELMQNEQANKQDSQQEHSLSSSVADMILNVAQAAAQATSSANDESQQNDGSQSNQNANGNGEVAMSSRGSIVELDTSPSSVGVSSMPSKADLKTGPRQWFNPKETIPVLKISSMGKFFHHKHAGGRLW